MLYIKKLMKLVANLVCLLIFGAIDVRESDWVSRVFTSHMPYSLKFAYKEYGKVELCVNLLKNTYFSNDFAMHSFEMKNGLMATKSKEARIS